jgi:hypothetical protein
MTMVSAALKDFVVARGWLEVSRAEAIARDAEQHGALTLACDERLDLKEIVACLLDGGRLTPAFIVRTLLCGRIELVAGMLAELGEAPTRKVTAYLRENRRAPLLAVLKRAGIPHWLAPLFPLAIAETRAAAIEGAEAAASTPMRIALRRILARLDHLQGEDYARLSAYLRGLEADAIRAEARELAEAMITLDEVERETARMPAGYAVASAPEELTERAEHSDAHRAPLDLEAIAVARAA